MKLNEAMNAKGAMKSLILLKQAQDYKEKKANKNTLASTAVDSRVNRNFSFLRGLAKKVGEGLGKKLQAVETDMHLGQGLKDFKNEILNNLMEEQNFKFHLNTRDRDQQEMQNMIDKSMSVMKDFFEKVDQRLSVMHNEMTAMKN